MSSATRILLIEDDEDDFVITRGLLEQVFERVELRWERTYRAGLEGLRAARFDACLLDYRLGAETGLRLLEEARNHGVETPIIMLTGAVGTQVDSELLRAGAADYLAKSELTAAQLARSIRYAKERAQQLEVIRRSAQEFRDVIDKLPVCIMIRRGDKLVYANPATAAQTGYQDAKELIGKSFYEFVHPSCHDLLQQRIAGTQPLDTRELCVFRGDGSTMWVEAVAEHIPVTFEGEPAFLTSVRDITEEKRNKALLQESTQRLQALSLTDELTHLYNRRGLFTVGERQLRLALRAKKPAIVLFMDLDGLKKINDQFGHEAGDAAILETTAILRSTFREVDILARLGGDEFVAILVDCEDSELPLRRLARNLGERNEKPHESFRLSISTGAATFDPENPDPLETLLQLADSAMYVQKRLRRAV